MAEFNEEEAAVILIQHIEWIIGSKQTVKEKPQTVLEESQADVMKSWSIPKFSTTTLACVFV
ncbi:MULTISPECIES: hypothetical protein [Bacillales]|uniref:Uncharacterized protein n=1 Tax=Ureibacillus manganicus DSM 26584 TaxID=1384049 RepID=A0A0A3IAL6_9BACL|nr:hypothetical protein [Ureibacillus manganicus]KGR79843.1 hypothetical protein CD29_04750 [Ureibacillus manganicus DSM 26584]